jgi:ureidoglycolate dehydrogenase (NAD+)
VSVSFEATLKKSVTGNEPERASASAAEIFVRNALVAAGTDFAAAGSVASALTATSLRGVDSHGIRLIVHYVKVVKGGRINACPRLSFQQTGPGTGIVDADNGFGHHASFFAMEHAEGLARDTGISAVSVINSSHFGSAGCYALHAAQRDLIAIAVCNSDSFVLPHDGIRPFHGTNPLAFAAPVPNERPYLVDMASSVIPWNRVQDLLNEHMELPPDVSVDSRGRPTTDPERSAALLPLGGIRYGYKGAALASMIEVLSAVITGMPHCSRLLPMGGPDLATHRRLGHFFIVIDPARFVSRSAFAGAMEAYLADLRAQDGREGARVLAPGDREWAVEDEREKFGIPVNDQLKRDFEALADGLQIERLQYLHQQSTG